MSIKVDHDLVVLQSSVAGNNVTWNSCSVCEELLIIVKGVKKSEISSLQIDVGGEGRMAVSFAPQHITKRWYDGDCVERMNPRRENNESNDFKRLRSSFV